MCKKMVFFGGKCAKNMQQLRGKNTETSKKCKKNVPKKNKKKAKLEPKFNKITRKYEKMSFSKTMQKITKNAKHAEKQKKLIKTD